ncbi:transposase [Candidatus Hakubella thermalkaliphila]|uniref:transposase n=1 Tax=Candidatus Hakubella thermalkaliphila TaxID=2754717 RepID=UPI0021591E69|nr:transposase [Candidatus Hakubella thermalkaliphila]
MDEVSYRSGHKYLTVVLDLEETKVVWGGEGRSKETLDKFFSEIGEERAKEIRAIATDMWDPYLASISEHAPWAKVVFDKFHVIAEYSKMIDRVRNEEYRAASDLHSADLLTDFSLIFPIRLLPTAIGRLWNVKKPEDLPLEICKLGLE